MTRTLAIDCYTVKQLIAKDLSDACRMTTKSINIVLAENLAYFMREKSMKQQALSERSGVAQTTISLYLNPSNRKDSASGKPKSGKLAEVEALAQGLEITVSDLLLDATPEQRKLLKDFLTLLTATKSGSVAAPTHHSPLTTQVEQKPKRVRSLGKVTHAPGTIQAKRSHG